MAVGLPVVATAVGGVPELVEHGQCGLLVPSRDTRALAAALTDLARHPELRRRFAAAARQRSQHFTAGAMVAAYAKLFEEVALSKR
jgi:glycosyltransferase involved in cell wall biosynthesis